MSTFKEVVNKHTGEIELKGMTELYSLPSETVLENKNGKKYRICSVKFINAEGNEVIRSAKIWEGNMIRANEKGGMQVGEQYLTTSQTDSNGQHWITVSHLQSGNLAESADFDKFYKGTTTTNKSKMPVGNNDLF